MGEDGLKTSGLEDGTNQLPQTTHTHHSFSQTHLRPITHSHSEPYREIESEEIKEIYIEKFIQPLGSEQ